MNPIAVSGTTGKVMFQGVAEAAANGGMPASLADLFGQILANAQAGITATMDGATPDGEGADGEDAVDSAEATAALAAALAAMPTAVASDAVVADETAGVAGVSSADALVADAAGSPEDAVSAEIAALLQPADSEETASPEMTLAMQLAAARAGLGPEGSVAARRFGDVAARPGQPGEGASESVEPVSLRELAAPSAKNAESASEQADTNSEGDDAAREILKPMPTLHHAKSGDTSPFEVNAPVFGGAEIHTAGRSRTEPLMPASQSDIPQSVSVRDVGDAVVRSVHYLSGRTEDVVTVRLMPQSLGELRIAVHSGERGMEVVLTAANNVAREALETNLQGLREALGREGMNIERVSVQVFTHFDAGHQTASQQNAHGNAGQHSARQSGTAYRESSGSPSQQQGSSEQQPRRQQHGGRLNMWV